MRNAIIAPGRHGAPGGKSVVADAREPVDFLDLGITVISLWDMAGLEDIVFATSLVPNDLGYGIL